MSPKEKKAQSWNEGESASSGEGVDKKATFGTKVKRNCSKWWWLYLLILIIVIVVVVIPIIFVAIPKAAQNEINKSRVEVNRQVMSTPTPENYDLVINSTVYSDSDRKAMIEGFNASYYLLDTKSNIVPFAYVEFPPVEAAEVSKVNIGQRMTRVASLEQFIAYSKLVQNSETFSFGIRGNTHVTLSGLPKYGITYDQVVTMKGFNKFKGFSIDQVQIHNPPLFDGSTMTGKVSIPNPSVISSQFGNVTQNLYANGTYLGDAKLLYVDYKPGNNSFDMRSNINLTLALQYSYNWIVYLDIVGNSSVNILGQHIPYFEAALQSSTINYPFNVTKALYG